MVSMVGRRYAFSIPLNVLLLRMGETFNEGIYVFSYLGGLFKDLATTTTVGSFFNNEVCRYVNKVATCAMFLNWYGSFAFFDVGFRISRDLIVMMARYER